MTERRGCVAVVGSINTDLVAYLNELPETGETVFGRDFATGFGGKGSNQAVMASLCGARVYLVGCVGDDSYGHQTLKHLSELGVRTEYLTSTSTSSGVALIWVERSGANRIVIVPGANAEVSEQQVERAVAGIENLQVVIGQLEIPMQVTRTAFLAAKERGVTTILNPAPATKLPGDLLAVVDWLVPNEHEFALMFGEAPNTSSVAKAAESLFAKRGLARAGDTEATPPASNTYGLVVTMGEQGALVWSGSNREVLAVPATQVDAIDTTGAGDAFVGAFSVALASGRSATDAAEIGCRCASQSVSKLGAQDSFPRGPLIDEVFST